MLSAMENVLIYSMRNAKHWSKLSRWRRESLKDDPRQSGLIIAKTPQHFTLFERASFENKINSSTNRDIQNYLRGKLNIGMRLLQDATPARTAAIFTDAI